MAEGELPGTLCVVGFLLLSSKIFAYDIIRDWAVQQAVTYILEPQPTNAFNTSFQTPVASAAVFLCVTSGNSFSQIAGFSFSPSHSSHPRVGVRARHRLGGSGVRRHSCLRGGVRHHLWMRQPPQGSTRRGVEVGRLQRGRGVRNHGLPGVRRCEGEPTRLALGYEPAQQRGRKNGGFPQTVFLFGITWLLTHLMFFF